MSKPDSMEDQTRKIMILFSNSDIYWPNETKHGM